MENTQCAGNSPVCASLVQVLETSWHKLVKDLKAAKDLDELIESHEEYIEAIKKNVRCLAACRNNGRFSLVLVHIWQQGFMAKDSRELLKQLKLIFDTIIMFSKTQENLYTTALREVHEEKMRQQAIEKRTLDVRCQACSCRTFYANILRMEGCVPLAGYMGNLRNRGRCRAKAKQCVRSKLEDCAPN